MRGDESAATATGKRGYGVAVHPDGSITGTSLFGKNLQRLVIRLAT